MAREIPPDLGHGRGGKDSMEKVIENNKTIGPTIGKIIPRPIQRQAQNMFIYWPRIKSLGIKGANILLFNKVYFEVRTRCNGNCEFCAASIQNETRRDIEMPFELYKKVIDELKQLNYSGGIAYHVNNDPLIFKDLAKFVSRARQALPDAWIQILTNGRALTASKGAKLLEAGINELTINDYNDDLQAPLPKNVQEFRDIVLPKYYKPEQIGSGHKPVLNSEANIFHFNVCRSPASSVKTSRAGTSPNKRKPSTSVRGFCEHPFTQFNITADSRVSMCCADFFFSVPIGNVKNESIIEIWYGNQFNKVRKSLLKGDRNAMETCRQCDYYGSRRIPQSFIAKFICWLTM